MLETIQLAQEITGTEFRWRYEENPRKGDHIWWISNLSKFESHFPEWQITYDIPRILREIYDENSKRWKLGCD
jgi:CDP-paratose 2-epimerase